MSMAMPDCPVCGHNFSAFAGSCTAIVVVTTMYGITYCGHDCKEEWDKLIASQSHEEDKTSATDEEFETPREEE